MVIGHRAKPYYSSSSVIAYPPTRLALDTWSKAVQLSYVTTVVLLYSLFPPRLARDAWSMVIQLRHITTVVVLYSLSPPPSRKGRVVNGHTT